MSRPGWWVAGLALAVSAAVLAAGPAGAQEVRGWTTTTFRYLEVRPLERVVLDAGEVPGDDEGRCPDAGECVLYLPSEVEGATAGTQDVGFTAWGLGVRGLSFTGHLRGRARFGGDFVWPRSEDEIDAILGFLQLNRERWRVRVGRQRTASGLGFTGYDGGSVLARPLDFLTLEAYGGRSLARGLAEPRNEALRGIEDFVLDRDAWLIGGFAQGRFDGSTEIGVRYQREIWSDRSGLISERASLDLRTGLLHPVRLRGSVDWDVAFGRVGKAELEVQRAIPSMGLSASVEGRRYVPYFELSTVWGFFSPVPYHEVVGRLAWSGGDSGAWARGGWRSYEDADVAVIFSPLEEDGWVAEAGASHRFGERWTAQASYEIEWGVGAFLSAGEARLRFSPVDAVDVALHGTTFQRIEEFRLGDGRVYGGGLDLGIRFGDRVRLDAGGAVYRHDAEDGPGDDIWDQTRVWSSLRIDFGQDPGRPRVRLRR